MDFFEEQALAKKRTLRLVLLFTIAVVGIVFAIYVLSMLVYTAVVGDGAGVAYITGDYGGVQNRGYSLWNPTVFLFSLYIAPRTRNRPMSASRKMPCRSPIARMLMRESPFKM